MYCNILIERSAFAPTLNTIVCGNSDECCIKPGNFPSSGKSVHATRVRQVALVNLDFCDFQVGHDFVLRSCDGRENLRLVSGSVVVGQKGLQLLIIIKVAASTTLYLYCSSIPNQLGGLSLLGAVFSMYARLSRVCQFGLMNATMSGSTRLGLSPKHISICTY